MSAVQSRPCPPFLQRLSRPVFRAVNELSPGFDLYANVAVPAADHARREQLCRYLLRPAVAQDRLRQLDDGRVALTLKSPWADGPRHLLFEPLTLLEKLAALIPRPRTSLVGYPGVLAPHSGWRARVVAYGTPPAVASPCSEASDTSKSAPRHWAWAALSDHPSDHLIDFRAVTRCHRESAISMCRILERHDNSSSAASCS